MQVWESNKQNSLKGIKSSSPFLLLSPGVKVGSFWTLKLQYFTLMRICWPNFVSFVLFEPNTFWRIVSIGKTYRNVVMVIKTESNSSWDESGLCYLTNRGNTKPSTVLSVKRFGISSTFQVIGLKTQLKQVDHNSYYLHHAFDTRSKRSSLLVDVNAS